MAATCHGYYQNLLSCGWPRIFQGTFQHNISTTTLLQINWLARRTPIQPRKGPGSKMQLHVGYKEIKVRIFSGFQWLWNQSRTGKFSWLIDPQWIQCSPSSHGWAPAIERALCFQRRKSSGETEVSFPFWSCFTFLCNFEDAEKSSAKQEVFIRLVPSLWSGSAVKGNKPDQRSLLFLFAALSHLDQGLYFSLAVGSPLHQQNICFLLLYPLYLRVFASSFEIVFRSFHSGTIERMTSREHYILSCTMKICRWAVQNEPCQVLLIEGWRNALLRIQAHCRFTAQEFVQVLGFRESHILLAKHLNTSVFIA